MAAETLLWLIPLPPLAAFILITLVTNKNKTLSHGLAIAGAASSWVMSLIVFIQAITRPNLAENPISSSINWLPTGETALRIGVQLDNLSAVVLFFVAWTILMIFIYSVGYHNYGQPAGERDVPGLPPRGAEIKDAHGHTHRVPSVEPMYSRFFGFLSLFAFAMYLLVVCDNLLLLYTGWEIMGLCSYLLIGFWYGKDSAKKAAMKAFMTTRIGDVFMLLGIVFLYTQAGTLNYREIFGNAELMRTLTTTPAGFLGLSQAAGIGLLLFIGTVGKSAQFPLHVWLPDAMEGPTPVSAMIHAATMVSAGVYLAIRIFPLLTAGWEPGGALTPAMMVVGAVGAFTALFAATIAVAQNDIKRVLAFSTISQLGYMIAAIGIGAYTAAIFHLVTHAFFKALLFLGSGSVIHGMEHGVMHSGEHVDAQDMLNMGGLRKKMPVTFWTFLIGGLALSGFPIITAGFWSKDEILAGAYHGGQMAIFITLALAALLTAFYTMRQITLTFFGQPRTEAAAHAHETPWTMTVPLIVLSVFAISVGWSGIPEHFPLIGGLIPNWCETFTGAMLGHEGEAAAFSAVPLLVSIVVSLGGLTLGWLAYRKVKIAVDPLKQALGGLHTVLQRKYFVDEVYNFLFIRPAVWISEVFTSRWMDRVVIDGFLHAIARAFLWLGKIVRHGFDVPVVNAGGDALAAGIRKGGAALSPMQSGRVQQYMVVTITVVMVFSAILFAILKLV
jgi:NADH-quinone oxidoreductase subunit L